HDVVIAPCRHLVVGKARIALRLQSGEKVVLVASRSDFHGNTWQTSAVCVLHKDVNRARILRVAERLKGPDLEFPGSGGRGFRRQGRGRGKGRARRGEWGLGRRWDEGRRWPNESGRRGGRAGVQRQQFGGAARR